MDFTFEKQSWSVVWKYFRREKDKAVCLLCQRELVYKVSEGATSNLLSHLNRKHEVQTKQSDPSGGSSKT